MMLILGTQYYILFIQLESKYSWISILYLAQSLDHFHCYLEATTDVSLES